MGKDYNRVTGAELLRADCNSQKIFINDKLGESVNLLSEKQFWGDDHSLNGLYYDYLDANNAGWSVEKSGWNDYSEDREVKKNSRQTENWIKQNVFVANTSTITVIQGYAGCGKTIFVNHLLRQLKGEDKSIDCHDIYVDYDNNSLESGYLACSIRNHFIKQLSKCLLEDDGLKIYELFVQMISKYGENSSSFSEYISLFNEGGLIAAKVKKLFENRDNIDERETNIRRLRCQFISGTVAMSGMLRDRVEKKGRLQNFEALADVNDRYIYALLECYITMDFLLSYAVNMLRAPKTEIVFYDNLDIIDNPRHVGFFILKLQEVLSRITYLYEKAIPTKPVFNVIITVRKITASSIASTFVDIHTNERGMNIIPIKYLDISNLYSPIKLLKHKALTLQNILNEVIPLESQQVHLKDFLVAILSVPDKTLEDIGLSELFNHNIRACANILEQAMSYSSTIIPEEIDAKALPDKCNSMIWTHCICAVLQTKHIWKNLGFNESSREVEYYPAALSRLILTYMYNRRRGYKCKISGYDSVEVLFTDLIYIFEKMPFVKSPKSNLGHRAIQAEAERDYSIPHAREKIIKVLSDMLKRNSTFDSINSNDELELWRRPIYYTRNVFPLVDENGNDNVERELNDQLGYLEEGKNKVTSFCITDEGYTFIERIVTNFEFFSVRFNGSYSIPLCFVRDDARLDNLINNVFIQVEHCVRDHLWLMNYYIKRYGISHNDPNDSNYKDDINQYLLQEFHPRTEHFKPQLHDVRTIFDHIYRLNDYRDYLISNQPNEYKKLNKTLVTWIGEYLELYRKNMFDLLDGSVGSFNDIYLDLKYLYWRVYRTRDEDLLPKTDDGTRFISICRESHPDYRKNSPIKIRDEDLKNDAMKL